MNDKEKLCLIVDYLKPLLRSIPNEYSKFINMDIYSTIVDDDINFFKVYKIQFRTYIDKYIDYKYEANDNFITLFKVTDNGTAIFFCTIIVPNTFFVHKKNNKIKKVIKRFKKEIICIFENQRIKIND